MPVFTNLYHAGSPAGMRVNLRPLSKECFWHTKSRIKLILEIINICQLTWIYLTADSLNLDRTLIIVSYRNIYIIFYRSRICIFR